MKRWLVLSLMFFCLPVLATPDMAMGGANMGVVHGIAGVSLNPANLAQGSWLGLTLQTEVDLRMNAWSPLLIMEMMAKDWSDQDKERILAGIPSSGLNLRATAEPQLGLKIGPLGLSMRGVVHGEGTLARDLAELILMGNELNRSYDLAQIHGSGVGYVESGVTLAWSNPRLALGATAKHLQGVGYGLAWGDGSIEAVLGGGVATLQGEGHLTLEYALEGTGYAFDLGSRVQITPELNLGLSLLNLGSITWTDLSSHRYEAILDLSENQIQWVEVETTTGQEYNWKLPLTLRTNLSYRAGRMLTLAGEVRATHLGTPTSQMSYGIGFEFNPLFILPIQLGLEQVDQAWSLNGGVGLRLPGIRIELAATNLMGFLKETDTRSTGVAVKTSIGF